MLPKIIIHNSISLDGSLLGFDVNMGVHYQIAGNYKPDAHLIGSKTVTAGFEMFGAPPPEEKNDFKKPEKNKHLPYWVIVDSKGVLKGTLHSLRRFEFCRDVIVLISEETPKEYVEYLRGRDYYYHIVGKKHAELKKALELLSEKYKIKTVLTDTGSTLSNLLLNQGLVREISLLVHPVIVGKKSENIFNSVAGIMKLKMDKCEVLDKGYAWLVYKIVK